MLKRALLLLFLLGVPAAAVSQDPANFPQGRAPLKQVAPTHAPAENQREGEEELKRLIASRDALTKQIQRLSKATGHRQQVIVSVKVCELSLNKARKVDFQVEGADAKWLHADGLSGALADGKFDPPKQGQETQTATTQREPVSVGVLEDDALFKTMIAELEKAGALKILAEPTLATVSGRPASLHFGGEFPIPIQLPNGQSASEFKKFGTQLDVVPEILGEEEIRLELRFSISELDRSLSALVGDLKIPGLRSRGVQTQIEMDAGQTFVLAGLVQQREIPKAPEDEAEADQIDNPEKIYEETELIVIVRAEIVEGL